MSWQSGAGLHEKIMFSKRVERWLESLDVIIPGKATIMEKGVEKVNVADIKTEPLLALVGYISVLLGGK
ncbi:hypothetical protein [Fimbriiglobus ruber]|uniref:hypothetical protein n=1 Tax=Fimbriiglobus ruber TaxID=1908690 RepID=UPI00117B7F4C|nr:hypothetical protein [Fimbriiglobus ruber]